jgi:predicted ATPase
MITRIAVAGYRSLRDLRLPLGRLNVVTGANGSGKSTLYRALSMLADLAQGRLLHSLALEGGFRSALWAGPETISRSVKSGLYPVQASVRKKPVALKLGFGGADYGYAVDLGLPAPAQSAFTADPQIKCESLWSGESLSRASVFAERNGPSVRIRDEAGDWRQITTQLAPFDSMMTHCGDPRSAIEVLIVRESMREWRFYDHLRTDRDAPARKPQVGVYTPVLSSDGADLAAAVQTIREIGDAAALDEAIADAFPGATVEVKAGDYFELCMHQHGLLRPLVMAEVSDGTLRFLLLAAALLSPRPPKLMILNEPETSLHCQLLPALARLIARAARRSQIVVVSHASELVDALVKERDCLRIVLRKEIGETTVEGAEAPTWSWPSR